MKSLVMVMGLILSLSALPGRAAEAIKIGYVDMEAVLNLSKAGKRERQSLNAFVKERRGKIKEEEKKLESMKTDFEKNKLVMSDAQKKEKQKAFQDKLKAYQQLVGDSQKTIKRKESEYMRRAYAEIQEILKQIVEQEKFTIILERSESGLLYADKSIDLTMKVIEKFDAKFAKGGK